MVGQSKITRYLERLVMSRKAYKFLVRDWVALQDIGKLADALASTRFTRNLRPVVMERPAAKRILIIAPHPDDEIIGPGGTVIKAIRHGAAVQVVYLTDDPGDLGAKRREETQTVSRHVGFGTEFLGYASGALPVDEATARVLATAVLRFQPGAVFVPFISDDHDEHRKASHLLLEARRAGVLSGDFEVWAYQVYSALLPNVVVDITEVKEDKVAAIRLWRESIIGRDWAHFALGLNAYNSRLLEGAEGERYVECFFVVPLDDYLDLCSVYFGEAGDGIYYG